jgi:hypothetical protein
VIDKVEVCGQEFKVTEIRKDQGNGTTQINFSVNIDGVDRHMKLEYTTNMVEALSRMHGLNAESELHSIVELEIKLDVFQYIHKALVTEIASGQRPDLIKAFVSEFGVGYIDSEVQEKYMDLIAEALQ